MAVLAKNKRAQFDYTVLETIEAGISLFGNEVRSIKTGRISLQGSFVTIKGTGLFLTNALIPFYTPAGDSSHYDPTRPRRLLVRKHDLKRLIGKARENGLTLIPLQVYTKKRFIKVLFALARGKKEYDKRATIKKREADREKERAFRTP